jgi:NADH dehydrogenase FAD-containing subunit
VLLGRVTGIDVAGRQVLLQDRKIAYDYLIVATARHAYFAATSGRQSQSASKISMMQPSYAERS